LALPNWRAIITYFTVSGNSFSTVGASTSVVGVAVPAAVESVTTAAESTVVVVVAVVDAPPHAANVAIATIAITYFINVFYFILLNIQPNSATSKFRTLLVFQP
jgi:hypothetical protein